MERNQNFRFGELKDIKNYKTKTDKFTKIPKTQKFPNLKSTKLKSIKK